MFRFGSSSNAFCPQRNLKTQQSPVTFEEGVSLGTRLRVARWRERKVNIPSFWLLKFETYWFIVALFPHSHSTRTARNSLASQCITNVFLEVGSLSTRVFETRTATGRELFACQDRIVSQIFILLISNGEKILSNVDVVVWGKVKVKIAHFRLPSVFQKRACLSSLISWVTNYSLILVRNFSVNL